jgi:hypothetical protein
VISGADLLRVAGDWSIILAVAAACLGFFSIVAWICDKVEDRRLAKSRQRELAEEVLRHVRPVSEARERLLFDAIARAGSVQPAGRLLVHPQVWRRSS